MSGTPKNDRQKPGAVAPPRSSPATASDEPTVAGSTDSEPEAVAATEGKKKPAFCGKPGRSGAPKGNTNGLRHGMKAGKLPADARYIEIRMNIFRRELERVVLSVKREISLLDAASIQTAMKWERHGALALRWLTKEADNLKPTERLAFSREIARASTERDRALALLNLDRDRVNDAWAVLDVTPSDGSNGDLEDK